jgi:hypothetical protein
MLGYGLTLTILIAATCLAASGATVRRETADILPPSALHGPTGHPLDAKMTAFLRRQKDFPGFKDSGITGRDYLRIIDGEVGFFRKCQDETGAIIDPVEKIEWQYSTPCYALSVALLHATGFNRDRKLLESGLRAMDHSVNDMHGYAAHGHGEFFIQPVMLALDLYEKVASSERVRDWKRKISEIDPYELYPDNLRRKEKCYNHNVVALAGEYLRAKRGLKADADFFETHMAHHIQYLTPMGMYRDNPGYPMVYDEFTRQFFSDILVEGYLGASYRAYRDAIWRGAWTSLFMLSPFGEIPTGGRSAQHIWNEASAVVTYETYAAQYARKGRMDEAGAFKRAAHLAAKSIERWLKPNGTGFVVKNRFPIEAHHGYERYSAQSQYNLLACWFLAAAYLYADDAIAEKPCPADIGGFVVPIVEDFHKIFANAGGTYIEYDTCGDLRYNPTGLIRVHLKGSNPQLGPSDGAGRRWDQTAKKFLDEGEPLCTGPAWQDASGKWHRLAEYDSEKPPSVQVLEENADKVRFLVTYTGDFDGVTRITETITVEPSGVTVEDELAGDIRAMRVMYPMLVTDGMEEAKIDLAGDSVTLSLWDGKIRYRLLEPSGIELKRTGVRLMHRNGEVEALYGDIPALRAVYRIELP